MHCRKITCSTVGIRFGQLFPKIVQTMECYSVNYQSKLDTRCTMHIYCRKITFSTVGIRMGQLFPNIVQTLVFYSRLPGLNRHWIDLVHPLSENYFLHSRNKVRPIVSQDCTNTGMLQRYLSMSIKHWVDLAHLLSENYLFHSRNKVGPIVSQHCTNASILQSTTRAE